MKLRSLILASAGIALAAGLLAQKHKSKKDQEPPTQVLPPLPEPPDAVTAETARVSFQISPLSARGLLSLQVRDALKALWHDNRGASIVKLRAFVAGSGDLRRVQQIASEEFTDRKQPLPAVSTIQVGGLPMVGAQVVIEATSLEKKPVNPRGLVFVSGSGSTTAGAAVEELKNRASGLDVLRVTCFLNSLDDAPNARAALGAAFPAAQTVLVQAQRETAEPANACEGVGRPASESASSAPDRGITRIAAPKLILTGTKLVFRDQDSDIRLALDRLAKSIVPLGADPRKDVFWIGVYPLTRPLGTRIEALQREFFPTAPAGTSVLVEGLPSIDATAAIELIAIAH